MSIRLQVAATILGFTFTANAALSQDKSEILIMGGRNFDVFLGCLTCSDVDPRSVWNKMSRYGWENKLGIWNSIGPHKSKFSMNSACNQYSTTPPKLVDRTGGYYGQLSTNTYLADSVCGPNGAERICMALRVMCAED